MKYPPPALQRAAGCCEAAAEDGEATSRSGRPVALGRTGAPVMAWGSAVSRTCRGGICEDAANLRWYRVSNALCPGRGRGRFSQKEGWIMIRAPIDVRWAYPVRKSKRQKAAFREAAADYLCSLGYAVTVEKGSLGTRNLLAGDPDRARCLITAHYDTCAVMPVPNVITPRNLWLFAGYQLLLTALLFLVPLAAAWLLAARIGLSSALYLFDALLLLELALMFFGPANPHCDNDNTSGVVAVLKMAESLPENMRDRVCFVLFDGEELGMLGSAGYAATHKQSIPQQLVLNLDCVGDGDEIWLFPTRKLRKDERQLDELCACVGQFGGKKICVHRRGFSIYPSDQMSFPLGVGICSLKRGRLGLYLDKIHTPRDRNLDETNCNLLCAAILSLICAPQKERNPEK